MWRPLLGMLFAEALSGKTLDDFETNKDVYYVCGVTELIHNSSLVIDDIEDNSSKRRGDMCVHKKFGVDVAINAGNFLMFTPMTMIDQYVAPEHQLPLYNIYVQEM